MCVRTRVYVCLCVFCTMYLPAFSTLTLVLYCCTMITTNVVVYNNTHLLAHSFCGLGIWTQLIWVINLGFYKAAINMSARAMVSSEA